MTWEPNTFNKFLLYNEQEFVNLVLSLKDKFPSVEHFENHFEMTPYDEEANPEEFSNGDVRPDTMKWKPENYPCLYVAIPLHTDDCRGFGGISGWWDEFIYPKDLNIGSFRYICPVCKGAAYGTGIYYEICKNCHGEGTVSRHEYEQA